MTAADLVPLLKKYPTSVACGLLSIACGVLIYVRAGNIAASQAELDSSSAEANRMITNVRNSTGIAEQVAEIQGYSKELESRLMKAGQLAVNLQYFYKLEAETEVKLADVRQNSVGRNARMQYVSVPFSVTVQGSFAHVMNFLTRLQAGRHFCRITAATISRSSGTSEVAAPPETADMNLSLTLELLGQQ